MNYPRLETSWQKEAGLLQRSRASGAADEIVAVLPGVTAGGFITVASTVTPIVKVSPWGTRPVTAELTAMQAMKAFLRLLTVRHLSCWVVVAWLGAAHLAAQDNPPAALEVSPEPSATSAEADWSPSQSACGECGSPACPHAADRVQLLRWALLLPMRRRHPDVPFVVSRPTLVRGGVRRLGQLENTPAAAANGRRVAGVTGHGAAVRRCRLARRPTFRRSFDGGLLVHARTLFRRRGQLLRRQRGRYQVSRLGRTTSRSSPDRSSTPRRDCPAAC